MAAGVHNHANDLDKYSTPHITTQASYQVDQSVKAHHACRKILKLARDQEVDWIISARRIQQWICSTTTHRLFRQLSLDPCFQSVDWWRERIEDSFNALYNKRISTGEFLSIPAQLHWTLSQIMSSFPDLLSPSHPSLEYSHHLKGLIFAQTIGYLTKKSEWWNERYSTEGRAQFLAISIELNNMANNVYYHLCCLLGGVPHCIKNITPALLALVHDDLAVHIDLLLQEHKLCVQRQQQKVLELEEQKKIAASTNIQLWHHRFTFRRLKLEQQFKLQQRLKLEDQNRLALEEQTRVELEIKFKL